MMNATMLFIDKGAPVTLFSRSLDQMRLNGLVTHISAHAKHMIIFSNHFLKLEFVEN